MSDFDRIDPNHPLTKAARTVNTSADEHGIEATLFDIGLLEEATVSQLFYLAEQRALRALAARRGDGNPTGAVWLTDDEAALMPLLTSAYLDGFAIAWAAAKADS